MAAPSWVIRGWLFGRVRQVVICQGQSPGGFDALGRITKAFKVGTQRCSLGATPGGATGRGGDDLAGEAAGFC